MNKKIVLLLVIACVISAIALEVLAGPAGQNNATNPNGTTRFTTDKYVAIQTMHPDINILNFRLGWQNFTGTFDTSAGTCTGCTFDLDNLTCQAEVEKIFGMFVTYNLTINLTTAGTINFTALNLLCRDGNSTVTSHPGCIGLFSQYPSGITSTGCMQWVNSSYATTFANGLSINLKNLTGSIQFNMGTMTPTPTCEMIACELNGTWSAGDTQSFTINKTITVVAN